MLSLYIDESDCDFLTGSGREPAICELHCRECGDGMKQDQKQCATCGTINPRYIREPLKTVPPAGSPELERAVSL